MPMYLITHKWPESKQLDAMKEAFKFFTEVKLPPDVKFMASYNFNFGAYTLWESPDRESIREIMAEFPVFGSEAEITEIVQSYPPTMEYTVRMWKMMLKIAGR